MNIKIDVDITPQEFRELMGWPNMHGFQQELMDKIREQMDVGAEGYDPRSLFQTFVSQSTNSMAAFQKLMTDLMGAQSGGARKGD